MVGLILKIIYLFLIKIVSLFCYFKKKKNVIYIMSFDNNLGLIKSMARSLPAGRRMIVFYENDNEAAATDLAAYGVKTIQFRDGISLIFNVVPIIMTGSIIFCDNYFAFLGGIIRSNNTKIVQMWHANGAIKKFGWEDPATYERSSSDKKRFQNVYNHFDEYVVASATMGDVFQKSYHVSSDRMKMLGYPRSDRLFKQKWRDIAERRVYHFAPQLKNKRVILYAPTYRNDGNSFNPPKKVISALTSDPNAIVIIKLHPLLNKLEKKLQKEASSDNVLFFSQLSTTDLLVITDTLVTDYSSIAFDYSLLPNAHSMLFYMFDIDQYQKHPGIQDNMLNWLPNKPIKTTEDLAKSIRENKKTDFTKFNRVWNKYNDGFATSRVIEKYIKSLK
ncbi:CDP-glycerol glycerophosphotransferase family protein [Apilactobacillus apisilvae]|uniref:CDP-glycerol glycerophosphotransferase family protein n=1 Tax=Apilactobacillus apisilvae TaxID=2923364 RepID=A0ABY4PJC7_9LACO|nr:CDP-glycerol glycerophosphotransferase family protein [Apilactobacillus apisilvae]UQS85452.1 CDP-glycerol glycerophosphotransferase family protein [Apilactobacillus apisilvae]